MINKESDLLFNTSSFEKLLSGYHVNLVIQSKVL